jgi:hypothetical protein
MLTLMHLLKTGKVGVDGDVIPKLITCREETPFPRTPTFPHAGLQKEVTQVEYSDWPSPGGRCVKIIEVFNRGV